MDTMRSLTAVLTALVFCSLLVPQTTIAKESDAAVASDTTRINAAVQTFVDRHELAGAVMLVADRNDVLHKSAVGFADVEKSIPMQTDSMFWIASQSKPITATAFMILVDEGKVSVDDPVEKYLPEFRGQMVVVEKDDDHQLLKKPAHPILIREVLSHTAGLPFSSALESPTLDRLSLQDRVRSYAMTPLQFQPGSNYRYSNAGINTAARIIEVVTGQNFESFLDERLFKPLGMTDTTFWPSEAQAKRMATSYKPDADRSGLIATTISQVQYPLTDRVHRTPMPAGGLFSTAHDLSRFYRMIANGGELDGRRYVSSESFAQMTSRQIPESLPNSYGFGFQTGGDTIGHGGAYSTNSFFDTKRELVFIWLVQHAGFPGRGKDAQAAFRDSATKRFAR